MHLISAHRIPSCAIYLHRISPVIMCKHKHKIYWNEGKKSRWRWITCNYTKLKLLFFPSSAKHRQTECRNWMQVNEYRNRIEKTIRPLMDEWWIVPARQWCIEHCDLWESTLLVSVDGSGADSFRKEKFSHRHDTQTMCQRTHSTRRKKMRRPHRPDLITRYNRNVDMNNWWGNHVIDGHVDCRFLSKSIDH